MSLSFSVVDSLTWTFSSASSTFSLSRAWLRLSSWKISLVIYEGMRTLKNGRRKIKVNPLSITYCFLFGSLKLRLQPFSETKSVVKFQELLEHAYSDAQLSLPVKCLLPVVASSASCLLPFTEGALDYKMRQLQKLLEFMTKNGYFTKSKMAAI